MRSVTHDLLSREATDWHQQGLIDRPLLDLLLQRYARRGEILATLLKWLGIFAILQLGLAVLASIAFLLKSALLAAVLLGAVSLGLWYGGVRLATDPRRLYPHTGAILVTASLAGVFGALILGYIAFTGQPDDPPIPTLMLLTSVLGAFTAYRYRLRWPLLLALLLFFTAWARGIPTAGTGPISPTFKNRAGWPPFRSARSCSASGTNGGWKSDSCAAASASAACI